MLLIGSVIVLRTVLSCQITFNNLDSKTNVTVEIHGRGYVAVGYWMKVILSTVTFTDSHRGKCSGKVFVNEAETGSVQLFSVLTVQVGFILT